MQHYQEVQVQISNRIKTMDQSPIRKLVPYAVDAKRRGIEVFHVNIGQPDIKTPQRVLDAIRNIPTDIIAYGPSEGLTSYRNALPSYYNIQGISVTPEDILVTTAGSEALIFAFMALCDPGDEIIVPEPYYANINAFAKMAGVKLVPIRTHIEDGFALPEVQAFEDAVTERTKAIKICNPNNPTGAVYSRSRIEELAELVKRRGLFFLADEVYREFVYDGKTHTSLLNIPGIEEHVVVADSISKRYSACGARVGALVSRNHDFLAGVLKMAQARLCPPTVEQIAAEAAVSLDASYYQETLAEYDRRRHAVYDVLKDVPGVLCKKPEGAFYIIARLPVEDAEDFAAFMLRDFSYQGKTVMVSPAQGFYATPGAGADEIRIAYVLDADKMRTAMDILVRGLEAYRSR